MKEKKDTTLQQIAENALSNSVVRLDVERETPLDPCRKSLIKIETFNQYLRQ